ncbi:hypothetical protein DPMN_068990 [Dreissena polymorpha]|uniref:Uncharacterized protein n=1 Tax=Dreissena polymorpha TaxID=45954 RepID=A0A9D3Z398_DREPO|nr:hypothetical protein DPMN_068990 [Dreissena polymorpha]
MPLYGPLSDVQELSPGSDIVHPDQPSIAYRAELVSAWTFNKDRSQCTLTSPYYATFCSAPFGRTRCTLTSLSAGILIRIGRITRHFAWPLSDDQELSPGSDLLLRDIFPGPFGRSRCTLTSRRLHIGLNYKLSAKKSDHVHAELPSAVYGADLLGFASPSAYLVNWALFTW